MSIKYDVYENPSPDNEEEILLHARMVSSGTISSRHLEEEIGYSTSLTAGDVKNVIASLSYLITKYLSSGKRIHIEGLGYFQVSIEGPSVKSAKELRGDHLKVKSVKFLPEQRMKKELLTAKFERSKRKNHSTKLSSYQIEELLKNYFQSHSYITRKEFQELCNLTRTTAINRIKSLLEEGKLIKGGIKGSPVYEWNG